MKYPSRKKKGASRHPFSDPCYSLTLQTSQFIRQNDLERLEKAIIDR
jgi:hypothetical protein